MFLIFTWPVLHCNRSKDKRTIPLLRNEKGIEAEMLPAVACWTRPAPVSFWSNFSLSLVTAPEVFTRVISAQLPSLRPTPSKKTFFNSKTSTTTSSRFSQ